MIGKRDALISVVIPSLNEEKNIANVIRDVRDSLSGKRYEIIVVDGNSSDRTAEIARQHGARIIYDSVGKGSALIKGMNAARGDIIISMDADLSHEAKELNLLIDGINIGYDVCMGSRFMSGGDSEDISPLRKEGNRFFVFLVNTIFGSHYSDMCYGYRAFNKKILKRLELREKGFGIETEISISAVKNRLRVLEVPSIEKKRAAGEPKLRTFRDGWVILRTIIKNLA